MTSRFQRLLSALKSHAHELRRRRVIRTAGAYLLLGWVALQIADVTFTPMGLPSWSQRALIITIAIGLVPVCLLSWWFDIGPDGVVRTDALPLLVNATPTGPVSAIASVAILSFADLSQSHDHDWFCDGLAEEIIASLCCVRGLRVASRSASRRFRGGKQDARDVGKQLNVDAILEGSVRLAGNRLRISAQLIDADSGYSLWSKQFERQLEDVFAIQSEIAADVVQALKLSLAGPALLRSQQYAPSNVQAYEFYLRGRQLSAQISETAWQQATRMFRRAIELDPAYAQAHAGLADCLAQQVLWRFDCLENVLPEATAAASRALDLAPDLAEAHVAQGQLRSLAHDHEGAARAFAHAIELNPQLHEAYYYYARLCFGQGDYAHAADLFQQAHRTRPDGFEVLVLAVNALEASGDHLAADVMTKRALAGLMHQIELEPDNARALYMAAGLQHRINQTQIGRQLAERALQLRPGDFPTLYNVACFYSRTGDVERALDLLEQAIERGGSLDWILHDPDLSPLHHLARFKSMVSKLQGNSVNDAN